MLPHGVDLVNTRAGRKQQPRGFPFLWKCDRNRGKWHEGGGATREQTDHQIFFSRIGAELRDALRSSQAAFVRHGMPAVTQLDQPGLRGVAVFYVHASSR